MTLINFPNFPEINDIYTFGDQEWIYNGFAWDLIIQEPGGVQGIQGIQGVQGAQGGQGIQGII